MSMSWHSNLNSAHHITRVAQPSYPSLLNGWYFNSKCVEQKQNGHIQYGANAPILNASLITAAPYVRSSNNLTEQSHNVIFSTTPLKRLAAGLFGGLTHGNNIIQSNSNFNSDTKILYSKQKPKRSKSVDAVHNVDHAVVLNSTNDASSTLRPHQLLMLVRKDQLNTDDLKNHVMYNHSNGLTNDVNSYVLNDSTTLLYNNQQVIDANFLMLAQKVSLLYYRI